MDQSEYNRFISQRWAHCGTVDKLLFINACGLMREAGDVVDALEKIERDGITPVAKQKLIDELGDLFFHFSQILRTHHISLDRVREDNKRKLVARDAERAKQKEIHDAFAGKSAGRRNLDH